MKTGKASLIPIFSYTLASTQLSPIPSQPSSSAPAPFFSTHTHWYSNIEDPDIIQYNIWERLGLPIQIRLW